MLQKLVINTVPPTRMVGTDRRGDLAASALPGARPDRLPDFDQVPVGVANVAAELASSIDRRREELRPAGAPLVVDGLDVRDAYVEEAADVVGISWRLERDGRLVVGG